MIRIIRDTSYNYCIVDDDCTATSLDVDDETAERWRKAFADYERAQTEIGEAVERLQGPHAV